MAVVAAAAARSAFRSSSTRSFGAKITSKIQSAPSFRFPKPIAAPRSLRSPAEMSFCVESLMPMHSVTAAALMTYVLSFTRGGYGWLTEELSYRLYICLVVACIFMKKERSSTLAKRMWS